MSRRGVCALVATVLVAVGSLAYGESGAEGWLRYAPLSNAAAASYVALPSRIVVLGDTPTDQVAANELQRGLASMLGRGFTVSHELPGEGDAIVLANLASLSRALSLTGDKLPPESFTLGEKTEGSAHRYIILGADPRGELYGVFHLLALVGAEKPLPAKPAVEGPSSAIRWVNQWDNLDGTIERGYAGRSIFFDNGHVRADLSRVSDYGRLLASIGINGVTVNNVNSDLRTLEPGMILEFARIADQLRPWGVRMSLAVDLSSPQVVGRLPTFDPVDPTVIAWWQAKVDEIYKAIPDFGGFVIKADSEGRLGPSKYGRTPAEAANAVARALKPHGGVVLYRGFVYNNHLDYNDLKADRARAGYDNFRALDGKFESNVVIQIKNGPIDFQVREPASPLFAALQRTNNQNTPVKEIVEGKSFHQPLGGFVGVANVGLDANWMLHPMAMANLYGFGRLAWNPELTTAEIIDCWTRLTFGNDPKVVFIVNGLLENSWRVYEQYTGPLRIGTLTNILGIHYGPGIESAERNGWGQWFRADSKGIGMDRTVATGTGYIGQYPPQLAKIYESLATCPDDLLLFMHHVPYDHVLHDGKTVVQHMYDSHYAGAAAAATYAPRWRQLEGLIDNQRYNETLSLFEYQAGHAIVWRDAVNQWFERISGIPDKQGRVGHDPNRIEA